MGSDRAASRSRGVLGRAAEKSYSLGMIARVLLALSLTLLALAGARAAESEPFVGDRLSASFVTAENGIAPDASTISAGLYVQLEGDWKTYWRTPGEVGLPPSIDWSGSENVASANLLYPAPTRFQAFGIENFGYKNEVLFPIEIALTEPGKAVNLRGSINLLVCEVICVPETFALSLDLPAKGEGAKLDRDAAALIADYARRIPAEGEGIATAATDGERLVVSVPGSAVGAVTDVFPEFRDATFGAPDIRATTDGEVWASFLILRTPEAEGGAVTLTGSDGAVTVPVRVEQTVPRPPDGAEAVIAYAAIGEATGSLWAMLGLAFLGGLILNVMPCVLPVLSLKLASAAKLGGETDARVRSGFLATASGIFAFVGVLALVLLTLRSAGAAVGWGVQFQSPAFLAAVVVLLTLFGLNLLGLFEIALPERVNAWMVGRGGSGRAGDFATGAFAALLATPCSAPFLGTAVAFALAGSALQLLGVFAALGIGLAFPYVLVTAVPRMVRFLPKPGPWMVALRRVLGVLVLVASVWFVSILAASVGTPVASLTLLLGITAAFAWKGGGRTAAIAVPMLLVIGIAVPSLFVRDDPLVAVGDPSDFVWEPFDRTAIAPAIARGEVVFVDVTADWCLTCKANKASTLDRGTVSSRLAEDDVLALRADWTRPDDDIRRYLNANGRYGIPFNAVYGPGAPDGIVLSEVLTSDAVIDAIERAKGTPSGPL